ncbi:uncharacterized protein LOC113756613 [Coffea eugenioides]|uniref:uncharacterized protein LOC113756613 n=1 Tax=Coffea eugenioides TaxID=49369 RepID=UPI000F611FE8|nr:uncharacterized protein LOC113756613 [Coffea eugenioides]
MGGIRTAGVSRGALSRGDRSGLIQVKGAPSNDSAVTPQVTCGYCGKPNHSENDCWRKSGKCLACGSTEYQLANCPSKMKIGGNIQRPKSQSLNRPVLEEVDLRCLLGFMHWIINRYLMRLRWLKVDLIGLAIKGYDMILGMDWLTHYNAQLNCKTKIVELCIPGEATLKLDVRGRLTSSALILGIRVRKMLSKGVQGYMTFLINTLSDKVRLEDMPVVKEFPDVFSEELESLPPEREITFKIDVTPGVATISRTPYRMAPAELKELKLQLQDLLERGFIKESDSPWRAPVLFVKKKDESLRLCIDY